MIGLLVTIPNRVGLVAMILVSRSSDRMLERRYHVAIPAIIAAAALVLLAATRSPFYSVTLLSFLAAGVYSYFGPFWALPSEFLTGFSAAAGIALINSVGALGGFAGPYMIGAIAMRTGNLYAGLALAGVPVFASAMLVLLLPRRARALEKGLVVRTEAERLDGLLPGPGADEVRQRGSCSRRLHFTLKPL